MEYDNLQSIAESSQPYEVPGPAESIDSQPHCM